MALDRRSKVRFGENGTNKRSFTFIWMRFIAYSPDFRFSFSCCLFKAVWVLSAKAFVCWIPDLHSHSPWSITLWALGQNQKHITGSTMLPLFSQCLSVSLSGLTRILNEQRVTYLHTLISSNHQWGGWQLMPCKELLIYVSGEINGSILCAWYMVLHFIFTI